MSSGFLSDVLRLPCLCSVIHEGFLKATLGCPQTEAAAAASGGCWGKMIKGHRKSEQCIIKFHFSMPRAVRLHIVALITNK